MAKSIFKLIIAGCFGLVLTNPLSTPCTEGEMIKPITALHEFIEEMQSLHADTKSIKEKLDMEINEIPHHIENIMNSCGEEKTEAVEKLKGFQNKIQMMEDIMLALDAGEMQKAKDLIENVHCKHIIQLLIWNYGTDVNKIEKLIDVTKMMNDLKMINIMNEGIIYVMDESKSIVMNDLIPLMIQQIETNKNKVEPELVMAAKLNLKEIAKRTVPHHYKALRALHEIDHDMANRAIYEVTSQMMTDSLHCPAWKIATKAPWIRMRVHALKAIFDKIWLLEIQNGMVATKALNLAKNLKENEEIKKCDDCMKILDEIINSSSMWAKNMENGYMCQGLDEMKALVTGVEKREEHNKYITFYNPQQDEIISKGKFIEKPDGDMLLITMNREYGEKWLKYSILVNNDDYPGSIHLKGNIVSKKILGKETATNEEICNMIPKPKENICVTLKELFTWSAEDTPNKRSALYENFLEHAKNCGQA